MNRYEYVQLNSINELNDATYSAGETRYTYES